MTPDAFFGERERPAPAARRRSDAAWAQVRDDYLAGASAPQLAERYGVSVSALRKRAREEAWRRSDAPDPSPGAEDEDDEAALAEAAAASPADLRPLAWARAALAVRRGRLQEALGWTRLVRQLDRMAEAQAASPALQARAAATLASAAHTLAALRRRLRPHEMHEALEASDGASEPASAAPPDPVTPSNSAHPRAGADPDLFQPVKAADAGQKPGPRMREDERGGAAAAADTPDLHEMHEMHEMHPAQQDGGSRPEPGGRSVEAPSVGPTAATSPAAAPEGSRAEPDPPAPPPPRPTGPAAPPIPPEWVRWRLHAG